MDGIDCQNSAVFGLLRSGPEFGQPLHILMLLASEQAPSLSWPSEHGNTFKTISIGVILGLYRGNIRVILRFYWGSIGVMLRIYSGYIGVTL